MPCTTDSPRPVPWSTSRVVKNGRKICSRVAASMPVPVSTTTRRTTPSPRSVRRVSVPPSAMAWSALSTRLTSTWVSWALSASMGGRPGAKSVTTRMALLAKRGSRKASPSVSTRFRSTGLVRCTPGLLNNSILRMISRACSELWMIRSR